MLLDRVREVLEGQRLLPPEPEWPERVLEALAGCLREGSPRRVALDEPGVGPRNLGRGSPLQQDFRDTPLVRRPTRGAPGEGPAVSREPGEEALAQPEDAFDRLQWEFTRCVPWLSHHAHSFLGRRPSRPCHGLGSSVHWFASWAEALRREHPDTRATIRCRTSGFITTCCAPARRAFTRLRIPSCSLRRAMETIEWKRGSPLRYLSTSKPSILGRSMPRKSRSAGPCRERKRSASSGSSKQVTWWPSRRRMTSRILRVVGEMSSTMTLSCRSMSVPLLAQLLFSTATIACPPHVLLTGVHQVDCHLHEALTMLGAASNGGMWPSHLAERDGGNRVFPVFRGPRRIGREMGRSAHR